MKQTAFKFFISKGSFAATLTIFSIHLFYFDKNVGLYSPVATRSKSNPLKYGFAFNSFSSSIYNQYQRVSSTLSQS